VTGVRPPRAPGLARPEEDQEVDRDPLTHQRCGEPSEGLGEVRDPFQLVFARILEDQAGSSRQVSDRRGSGGVAIARSSTRSIALAPSTSSDGS
jgi:hypothetical protein